MYSWGVSYTTWHIHKSPLLQIPLLLKLSCSRCEQAWTGYDVTHPGSSLLFVLALWVMAGVPSCLRVSATQRDDEDTIQDTLGRTLKARNEWGHERGHGHGRECLLCSECELCKDLPVYFCFYGDWVKRGSEEELPSWVSTLQHPEYQGETFQQAYSSNYTFKACELKDLLLRLIF